VSNDEAYDPTAPESDAPKSSAYVTKKDAKIVAVAIVVLGVLMYPVYIVLLKRSEKARCINNMHGMMAAINEYAVQNDDKFPPLYDAGPNDEPMAQSSGAPFTWASNLQEYMGARVTFQCPSAQDDTLTRSQDTHTPSKSFALSYGMFAPMGTFNRSLVEDPDEAALIAETDNRGSENSYDPLPFKDASGNTLPYDGMVVGWDNDNFDATDATKYVTRLAFPDSAGAKFEKDGGGRHDEGSFVLTVTGQLRTVKPTFARVQRRYGKYLYGPWPMPITAKRHQ